MFIFKTKNEIRDFIQQKKKSGCKVGFVPTMGYLHQGHLSLIENARKDCDIVVVSIFVNPLQFGPKEDYSEYPRNLEKDCRMLEMQGVEALFYPEVAEMYSTDFSAHVEVISLTDSLCGKARPGHFRGVTTVVAKLFNIIQPDRAYFGQKDAQQVLVVKKMAKDLDFPIEIITIPTVREKDGLAMSSRNVYLTPKQRTLAPEIYKSLQEAARLAADGETQVAKLEQRVKEEISSLEGAQLEYVEIRSLSNLERKDILESRSLMAVAVRFGKTRLIDNIILEV